MELYEKIKIRIDVLRKAAGLNQTQFLERAGIDRIHYHNINKGNTRWNTDTLQKAANALKVPVEYLFFDPIIIPSQEDQIILSMYKALSTEGREKVLSYIRYTMGEEGIPHLDDFRKE